MGAATHSAAGPALEQSQDRCSEHLRGRSWPHRFSRASRNGRRWGGRRAQPVGHL